MPLLDPDVRAEIVRLKKENPRLTQHQIAQEVGCSQKHVSKTLGDAGLGSPNLTRFLTNKSLLDLSAEVQYLIDQGAFEKNSDGEIWLTDKGLRWFNILKAGKEARRHAP